MKREGFVEIDNHDNPVIPATLDVPLVQANSTFESGTKGCCGCQRLVLLRPEREKPRNYCRKCDSYLCDDCALSFKITGEHTPFVKIIDDFVDAAASGRSLNPQIAR